MSKTTSKVKCLQNYLSSSLQYAGREYASVHHYALARHRILRIPMYMYMEEPNSKKRNLLKAMNQTRLAKFFYYYDVT